MDIVIIHYTAPDNEGVGVTSRELKVWTVVWVGEAVQPVTALSCHLWRLCGLYGRLLWPAAPRSGGT